MPRCELCESYAAQVRDDMIVDRTSVRDQGRRSDRNTHVILEPPLEKIAEFDVLRLQEEPVKLIRSRTHELFFDFFAGLTVIDSAALFSDSVSSNR